MANTKLIFYGTDNSNSKDHELECYCNIDQDIYISIDTGDIPPSWICLDKPTAIKLVKNLKSEINNIGGHDE